MAKKPTVIPQTSTAVLLFNKEGKILLHKRISNHQNGKFGCPGGKADFGETLKETAERELFEETGIHAECSPTGYLANCVYRKENKQFLCVWFTAKTDTIDVDFIEKDASGKPKGEAWKWFSYEEILYLPMMPSTVDALVHLRGIDAGRVVVKEYDDKVIKLKEEKSKKVVKITLEYDDGELRGASGKNADQIWKHIEGAETMAHIHGYTYHGPTMKPLRKKSK